MAEKPPVTLEAGPEQVRYASILEKGMYIGLLILLLTYAVYATGMLKPYIPLEKMSGYWGMNVHDYLHHADIKPGWHWVFMLNYSDFLNFIGIALLAGTTILCYISIIPILLKNRDRVYAVLAVLEVVILSLAASGILAIGH